MEVINNLSPMIRPVLVSARASSLYNKGYFDTDIDMAFIND